MNVTPAVSIGNPLQASAIVALVSAFLAVRHLIVTIRQENVSEVNHLNADSRFRISSPSWTVPANSVAFSLIGDNGEIVPNTPVFTVSPRGRFALPAVKSYREGNVPNLLAYPGATSFDAALFADSHILKQSGAYRRAPQSVDAGTVGNMAANVAATPDAIQAEIARLTALLASKPVAPVSPAPTGISAETGQDTAKLTAEIQGKPVELSDTELEKMTAPTPPPTERKGKK